MSVTLNGFVIDGHFIEVFKAYMPNLILKGNGPAEEGICSGLNRYKIGDIVKLEDNYTFRVPSGYYKIEQIECSVNPQTGICNFSIAFTAHEGR